MPAYSCYGAWELAQALEEQPNGSGKVGNWPHSLVAETTVEIYMCLGKKQLMDVER